VELELLDDLLELDVVEVVVAPQVGEADELELELVELVVVV
jgi:hypothetical protein